ncbi:hypothetical protein LOTGIDRAFT_165593 [Lottia gigantea]|uniref:Peptidase M60 domain-containing protein n=1 Tax=Lottia gigantea TaxID=225164 RepID=V4A0M8_LOTGI|nr:hypothetical protein LOTGIDRAFT_165593 [Lottia gigantea]ESO88465.1 hypothetical protein LOTGIDRAFT_165593 [Lottia gigantea]
MSNVNQWQAELLAGVEVIPNTGAVPATLTIRNPQAYSIIPGPNSEIWVAAVEIGRGRVLVVGHEGYLTDFTKVNSKEVLAQLHLNIKLWLTRGQFNNNREIGILGNPHVSRNSLPRFKILIWNGADDTQVSSDDLLQYVHGGGSVVHCACAWGWLQLRPDKSLNDMPFKHFLDNIGISYNNAAVFLPEEGLPIAHLVPSNIQYKKLNQASQPALSCQINDRSADQWRQEILRGVSKIPHTGAVPGSLVVFGDSCRAILSGTNPIDVWIAAAELGEGRVMVVAHEGYLAQFNGQHSDGNLQTLHRNMRNWLTRANNPEVIYADSRKRPLNPKNGTILVWSGQNNVSFTNDEVLNFVISGGAFVHTMCPWGWLMGHKGKSFDDQPFDPVLDAVGIGYTKRYVEIPADGLDVQSCCSSEQCHLGRAVDASIGDARALSQVGESLQLLSELTDKKLHMFSGKLSKLSGVLESTDIDYVPSEHCPVKSSEGKALIGLCETLNKMGKVNQILPGIANFPGDFESTPSKTSVTLTLSSYQEDVHPTGYYVQAGDSLAVSVLSQNGKGWTVQIGAHSDCLSGQSELKRWPNVVCCKPLNEQCTIVKATFGGLVYFTSPSNQQSITVQLDNVIQAPLFDLTLPTTIEQWNGRRQAPGLWADICSEFLIITLPSKSIRNLDGPVSVMKKWDEVLKAHFHLKGIDIRNHRKQWLVTDVQPSAGYMHSGYPVVTHLDVANPSHEFFLLNSHNLNTKGSWGVFHEFGHNMQEGVWTFPGTTEVTVNIFTLHAMDTLIGKRPIVHEWLQNQMSNAKRYLYHNDQNYSHWKSDPGIALFIYAQIAHHLGWGVFKEVFRRYGRMNPSSYPNKENDQIDLWYTLLSEVSQLNLASLVDFWKIPLSDKARREMSKFQPFLPDDDVMRMAPERTHMILAKYHSNCLRQPAYIVKDDFNTELGPVPPMPRLRCL